MNDELKEKFYTFVLTFDVPGKSACEAYHLWNLEATFLCERFLTQSSDPLFTAVELFLNEKLLIKYVATPMIVHLDFQDLRHQGLPLTTPLLVRLGDKLKARITNGSQKRIKAIVQFEGIVEY